MRLTMRRATALGLALTLAAAQMAIAQAPAAVSPVVAAAIADPHRPEADRAADADRNPAALLKLAGIQPGWRMADLMQGSGYFTRLFLAAAGPKGKVYDWSPPEFIAVKKALYGDSLDLLAKEYPSQVVPMRNTFDDLAFLERLDLVFQSQNYHDLHLTRSPPGTAAKVNAAFKALKPGGHYIIIDHVANAGDLTAPDWVHRGDPAAMRKEVEAAGFVFDGESDGLRNPADDHTKHVFDASIRGHTDQVIYRFRRP